MKKLRVTAQVLVILLALAGVGHGRIAFVANVAGNWDLYMADDDGGNPVRLTRTAYDEKDPAWSPDRKEIVYAASDGQLNIVRVGNREIRTVAETGLKTPKVSPCFSPDGRQIAFAQFRRPEEGDDTDLVVYDRDTGRFRRLLDQYAIQMWPAWSPDGSRIIYANMHCSADCGRLIQELWIAEAKGEWSRQLLMTHSFSQQPAWSPDGRRLAFSSDRSGNYDIWESDLSNMQLRKMTAHEGLDVKPAWSADGKRLAFVSTRSGIMEIWVREFESGKVKRLAPFGDRKVACKDVAW